MRLTNQCPWCSRTVQNIREFGLSNGETLIFWKCGHFVLRPARHAYSFTPEDFTSIDNRQQAYEYQSDFVKWAFNSVDSPAVINADQMGLGKTPQALLVLRKFRKEHGPVPCLIVVPGATLWQWFHQYKNWSDPSILGCYLINGSKTFIPPGFNTYVIPMDTFSRMVTTERTPTGKILQQSINPQLVALGIKFLIVDECHKFKDSSSNRATALVAFCKETPLDRKVFLSGTPIKNRADEYFTILNIIDPEEFPTIEEFRRRWLIQDDRGRWTRVHPHRLEAFRRLTARYMIRRENDEVKKDLPPFRRTFSLVFLEDDGIKKQYNKELKNLENMVKSTTRFSFRDVFENLMVLRRLCGIGKVGYAADYIETCLDSASGDSERGIAGDPEELKIAVGVHHHAVRDGLFLALKSRNIPVLKLSGEDSNEQKYKVVQDFRAAQGKCVIIISSLAGGTGVDGLQVCSKVINLERQWNSVDEEQFEARFWRDGQKNAVHSDYLVASGTIDEWFCELVEAKRQIFQQTVSNNWDLAGDESMLKDLVNKIILGRLT